MAVNNIFGASSIDDLADNVLSGVDDFMLTVEKMQKRKVASNVQLVVQALKKIESDLQDKYDGVTTVIEKRVSTIKDGRDGTNGRDGRDGKDGRPGKDGLPGARGKDGMPGADGRDGEDGVSVTDARIDFDGSLIIGLSSGREINVGEVVAPDLAERIKVITNGGGTSQGVLDTLASLQSQINAISNLGAVNYQGTWNASTNNPTIVAGTGDKGDYYVVSVAGSTNIDGQTLWGVGDWIIFNGVVWQKVDGGSTGDFTNITASGSLTLSGGTANGVMYLNGSKVATTGSNLTYAEGASNQITVTGASASYFTSTVGVNTSYFGTNGSGTYVGSGTNVPVLFYQNNTVGMSLTSTGLSLTANPTLSGGTANGVAYLNGSKVLTTGSALTFDGTNLALGGYGRTTGTGWQVLNNGLLTTYGADASGTLINNLDGGPIQFQISSAEQMRLTSTGLGIGTSSPSTKLDVIGAGTLRVDGSGTTTPLILRNNNTASVQVVKIGFDSSGAIKASINAAVYGNDYMTFNVGSDTERMRLDSSGNLGLGGTSFGSGAVVMFIANATTVPTTNPTGGGVLYVEGGALKYRGSSGTVTTIANA